MQTQGQKAQGCPTAFTVPILLHVMLSTFKIGLGLIRIGVARLTRTRNQRLRSLRTTAATWKVLP